MTERAFKYFCWGFAFVMLDFRLNGLDILPDIVGYAFFIAGLNLLIERNDWFQKSRTFNIVMLILSVFTIYERQAENTGGLNINIDLLGLLVGILSLIFSLLAMYNLFMGIKQMADEHNYSDLSAESERRWKQFIVIQLAGYGAFLLIFIPILAVLYIFALLIFAILLTVKFMSFMTRCGSRFNDI